MAHLLLRVRLRLWRCFLAASGAGSCGFCVVAGGSLPLEPPPAGSVAGGGRSAASPAPGGCVPAVQEGARVRLIGLCPWLPWAAVAAVPPPIRPAMPYLRRIAIVSARPRYPILSSKSGYFYPKTKR